MPRVLRTDVVRVSRVGVITTTEAIVYESSHTNRYIAAANRRQSCHRRLPQIAGAFVDPRSRAPRLWRLVVIFTADTRTCTVDTTVGAGKHARETPCHAL